MLGISIHAPREGGDFYMAALLTSLGISIHAPREGGDDSGGAKTIPDVHFNPRPPRGGRRSNFTPHVGDIIISIHAPREGGDSKDAQFYL